MVNELCNECGKGYLDYADKFFEEDIPEDISKNFHLYYCPNCHIAYSSNKNNRLEKLMPLKQLEVVKEITEELGINYDNLTTEERVNVYNFWYRSSQLIVNFCKQENLTNEISHR